MVLVIFHSLLTTERSFWHLVIFLFLFFLGSSHCIAQTGIIIEGNAPGYANESIDLFAISDFINNEEIKIGSLHIKSDGTFNFRMDTDEVLHIYLYLGVYKGYMLVVPGGKYEVKFPPRQRKTPQEKLNPYFELIDFNIAILNGDSLETNMLISNFDFKFDSLLNKYGDNFFFKGSNEKSYDIIDTIKSSFVQTTNRYFEVYQQYKFASLHYYNAPGSIHSIGLPYFNSRPVFYNNASYNIFFKMVFYDFFTSFIAPKDKKELLNHFFSYNIIEMKNMIGESINIKNDTLAEYILLNEIYDNLYKDKYPTDVLVSLLDSIKEISVIKKHQIIAHFMKENFTSLWAGYKPYNFYLQAIDNKNYDLEHFEGKLIYLNFCSLDNYTCQKDFKLMENLFEKYNANMYIISILDNTLEEIRYFVSETKYKWMFLTSNSTVLKKYNVKHFPLYYLIGTGGKLILNNAPSPAENIESLLIEIFNN